MLNQSRCHVNLGLLEVKVQNLETKLLSRNFSQKNKRMNLFFYPDNSEILETWSRNSSVKYFRFYKNCKLFCASVLKFEITKERKQNGQFIYILVEDWKLKIQFFFSFGHYFILQSLEPEFLIFFISKVYLWKEPVVFKSIR